MLSGSMSEHWSHVLHGNSHYCTLHITPILPPLFTFGPMTLTMKMTKEKEEEEMKEKENVEKENKKISLCIWQTDLTGVKSKIKMMHTAVKSRIMMMHTFRNAEDNVTPYQPRRTDFNARKKSHVSYHTIEVGLVEVTSKWATLMQCKSNIVPELNIQNSDASFLHTISIPFRQSKQALSIHHRYTCLWNPIRYEDSHSSIYSLL